MNKILHNLDPFWTIFFIAIAVIAGSFFIAAKESISCDERGGIQTRYGCLKKDCKL